MKIRIRSLCGGDDLYEQNDSAAVNEILASVNHQSFFKPEHLAFETEAGLRVYPAASVVRVDFDGASLPEWQMLGEANSIREISTEDFHGNYKPLWDATLLRGTPRKQGEDFSGFVRLALNGADPAFLLIEGLVGDPLEDRMMSRRVLSASAFFFMNAAGGHAVVNPANVIRIDVLPGRPGILPDAWKITPV